ncbi:hypothetical protein, partial [Belnapia arida]|uniref:hypothetical protein n=1 Tax=Belnapia arida TaxID=2804533 RepID=UPI001F3C8CA8
VTLCPKPKSAFTRQGSQVQSLSHPPSPALAAPSISDRFTALMRWHNNRGILERLASLTGERSMSIAEVPLPHPMRRDVMAPKPA